MLDPDLQMRYLQFHMAEMDYNTDMYDARTEGGVERSVRVAKKQLCPWFKFFADLFGANLNLAGDKSPGPAGPPSLLKRAGGLC